MKHPKNKIVRNQSMLYIVINFSDVNPILPLVQQVPSQSVNHVQSSSGLLTMAPWNPYSHNHMGSLIPHLPYFPNHLFNVGQHGSIQTPIPQLKQEVASESLQLSLDILTARLWQNNQALFGVPNLDLNRIAFGGTHIQTAIPQSLQGLPPTDLQGALDNSATRLERNDQAAPNLDLMRIAPVNYKMEIPQTNQEIVPSYLNWTPRNSAFQSVQNIQESSVILQAALNNNAFGGFQTTTVKTEPAPHVNSASPSTLSQNSCHYQLPHSIGPSTSSQPSAPVPSTPSSTPSAENKNNVQNVSID